MGPADGHPLPSARTVSHADLDQPGLLTQSRGCSSMVEPQPSKLAMPVRSRSPAPRVFAGQVAVRARGGAGDGAPTVACLPPLGDARLDGRRPDGRLVPLTGAHVRWASQQSVTSTATTCHRKPARSVRQSRRLPDGDRSPAGVDPSHRERVLVVVDSCEHRTPTARGTAAGQSAGTSRDHAGVLTPLSSVSCPDRTAAGRRPSERASAQGRAARGRAFPTAARTPSMPGRAHQTRDARGVTVAILIAALADENAPGVRRRRHTVVRVSP
jgi:hypothetical protein